MYVSVFVLHPKGITGPMVNFLAQGNPEFGICNLSGGSWTNTSCL